MDIEKLAVRLAAMIAEVEAGQAAAPEKPAVPILYTVPEVTEYLRCADSTVWQLIRNGDLGSVRVGRKRLIPAEAINAYLNGQTATA